MLTATSSAARERPATAWVAGLLVDNTCWEAALALLPWLVDIRVHQVKLLQRCEESGGMRDEH